MNILILTRGKLPIPNIKGGAVEYLIQMVIDENERKWHHRITVCSLYVDGIELAQKKYKYTEFINVKTINIAAKIETGIRYVINTKIKYIGNYFISYCFKKLTSLNKFDVIIDENAPDFIPLLRKRYSGRLIYHGHNDWINKDNYKDLIFCDEYWAISGYLKNQAVKLGVQIPIRILYNGIQIEKYSINAKGDICKIRNKYGIDDAKFIFIYAGRIVEEKGVLEAIKAFKAAKFDHSIKLLIAGGAFYSSSKLTKYMCKCQNESVGFPNIVFLGYIPNNQMGELYQCADVGLFPSKWQEPFGLSLVEMMASGLPVITTNKGAIPEIVNNETACVIDTSDQKKFITSLTYYMRLLLENENLRFNMAKNGLKRAKMFSHKNYLSLFEKLLVIPKIDDIPYE